MKWIRTIALAAILMAPLLASGPARAQEANDPPAAPVPSLIYTAQKVFISNASGEQVMPAGTPDLAYNEFYSGMKNWGRYTIVANPADADLIFQIRFKYEIGATVVMGGSGSSGQDFSFQLIISEAKTRAVLWAFSENVKQSGNQKQGRGYFDSAMKALVADVTKLATPPAAASPGRD